MKRPLVGLDFFLLCCLALAWIGVAGFIPVQAQVPVFEYAFPDSWDGSAATVTDLSSAGNDANPAGAVLSTTVPPGSPAGSRSIETNNGGLATQNTLLLENSLVAAGGGFRMDATFLWDGTNDGPDINKIIDYAGTEFLQIEAHDLVNGTAMLRFGFNDDPAGTTNLETAINANEWYEVTGIFDTQGNGVAMDGSVSGHATLIVNGMMFEDDVTKTDFGDSFSRPIAVGSFSAAPTIIELHGNIFNASVSFLVPEPTSVAIALCGFVSFALLVVRRRPV